MPLVYCKICDLVFLWFKQGGKVPFGPNCETINSFYCKGCGMELDWLCIFCSNIFSRLEMTKKQIRHHLHLCIPKESDFINIPRKSLQLKRYSFLKKVFMQKNQKSIIPIPKDDWFCHDWPK